MKYGTFLLMTAMLTLAGEAMAQTDNVVALLPDGVQANVNPERKQDKAKNLVVAGSPEKGYKAFFAATDNANGEELWVTDGTKEDIPVTPDMVSGFDGNTEGWQTLTVACPYATDSELTYNVHVTDPGLPPAEEEKLLGDANCDGIVDIVDATAIQSWLAGLHAPAGIGLPIKKT